MNAFYYFMRINNLKIPFYLKILIKLNDDIDVNPLNNLYISITYIYNDITAIINLLKAIL
jgi:hypothetical protein